jgi:catechol 2,3-dioxygenase-like lactoylglutathione lyase family enzyme
MAVETSGIRHIHLLVRDLPHSVAFYEAAFGMTVAFRDGKILFLRSPSGGDDLALHQASTPEEKARVGQRGGFEHFGITVTDRTRLDEAILAVEAAGGALVQKSEHAPGVPCAYISDPDGYIIEI